MQSAAACVVIATSVLRVHAVAEWSPTPTLVVLEAVAPFAVSAADAESALPPKVTTSACCEL